MNHEHLMKFTLRQMEMERKSTLKTKKKLPNFISNLFKTQVVVNKQK
jgi:hypothetical protein